MKQLLNCITDTYAKVILLGTRVGIKHIIKSISYVNYPITNYPVALLGNLQIH